MPVVLETRVYHAKINTNEEFEEMLARRENSDNNADPTSGDKTDCESKVCKIYGKISQFHEGNFWLHCFLIIQADFRVDFHSKVIISSLC